MARSRGASSTAASRSRWCRSRPDDPGIEERYKKSDDDSWIEDTGYVVRLIPDDHEGVRHQRFILQLPGRQTLLIAHNLDLSQRVPVGMGDRIRFRGIYEWNDQGGLVHWTHRDPQGEEDGGWISHRRKTYC